MTASAPRLLLHPTLLERFDPERMRAAPAAIASVLQGAQAWFAAPKRWAPGYARDRNGREVGCVDKRAASMSLWGAVDSVAHHLAHEHPIPFLTHALLEELVTGQAAAIPVKPRQILTFSDGGPFVMPLLDWEHEPGRTQADVVVVLERALAHVAAVRLAPGGNWEPFPVEAS